MYTPEQFAEEDSEKTIALVNNNPFGMLITEYEGSPCISHLPFLFEPDFGTNGKLIAHMAKDNPQWKSLIGAETVIVVFSGAHGYISPAWYSTPGVPTWNYAVVHLYGKPRLIDDPAGVEKVLQKLTTHFESGQESPWEINYPIEKNKLLQMIVGFEIDIQKIESKFKLSQNRTDSEQQNIVHELSKSNHNATTELADFMACYFSKNRS